MTTLSPPAATPKLPAIPGRKGRPVRRGAAGWLPVAVLPVIAWVATRDLLPEWGFMWAMCFVLYAGCKWLTLADALFRNPGADRPRILAYLLTWPGMDATAFLHGTASPGRPATREWVFAFGKFIFGVVLTWGLALLLAPTHPFLAGWVGMVGLIFVLHFGAFHLLSLAWRR
ncbi:MAG TPA: hypothetical protein VG734_25135, partial [Lacunisphaera sp.]|nr:hypothetical protein [Lacunisphaera sp.]